MSSQAVKRDEVHQESNLRSRIARLERRFEHRIVGELWQGDEYKGYAFASGSPRQLDMAPDFDHTRFSLYDCLDDTLKRPRAPEDGWYEVFVYVCVVFTQTIGQSAGAFPYDGSHRVLSDELVLEGLLQSRDGSDNLKEQLDRQQFYRTAFGSGTQSGIANTTTRAAILSLHGSCWLLAGETIRTALTLYDLTANETDHGVAVYGGDPQNNAGLGNLNTGASRAWIVRRRRTQPAPLD